MTENKSNYVKRDKPAYRENPFISELVTSSISKNKYSTVSASARKIVDESTGELTDMDAVQVTRQAVERNEFVKIFATGITSMFSLSKASQDVFKLILSIYLEQKNTPLQIYVNEDVLSEMGYKRKKATRIKAFNELINLNFIAQVASRPNLYWINPNMFYKGNRLTVINQYALKGTPEGDKLEHEMQHAEALSRQQTLA